MESRKGGVQLFTYGCKAVSLRRKLSLPAAGPTYMFYSTRAPFAQIH